MRKPRKRPTTMTLLLLEPLVRVLVAGSIFVLVLLGVCR